MNTKDLKEFIDKAFNVPSNQTTHPCRIGRVTIDGSVFRLFQLHVNWNLYEVEVKNDKIVNTTYIKHTDIPAVTVLIKKYKKLSDKTWINSDNEKPPVETGGGHM